MFNNKWHTHTSSHKQMIAGTVSVRMSGLEFHKHPPPCSQPVFKGFNLSVDMLFVMELSGATAGNQNSNSAFEMQVRETRILWIYLLLLLFFTYITLITLITILFDLSWHAAIFLTNLSTQKLKRCSDCHWPV